MSNAISESGLTFEEHNDVTAALLAYWTSRDEARLAQEARGGVLDVGGRSGVTSGGHLDRVAQLLGRVCIAAGAPDTQVYYKAPKGDPVEGTSAAAGFILPGWFRPTKQWDVVVHHGSGDNRVPIAVIELKSQNGPSYSSNSNNRAEEALGNALDLASAKREGLIPGDPWTGYVFVIEDDVISSETRGRNDRGFYRKAEIFNDWSYVSRVQHLCEMLVREGLYNASWGVATRRPSCPGTANKPNRCPQLRKGISPHQHQFSWRDMDSGVSGYAQFVGQLRQHIASYYPESTNTALTSTTNPALSPRRAKGVPDPERLA